MKVYVYAICKNERKFALRWMKSMSEADGVYVLDTGSEDGTVELLRGEGAIVEVEVFKPWRFDTAPEPLAGDGHRRTRTPASAPTSTSSSTPAGALLEAAWKPDTTRAAYRYTWNFNPDGSEGFVFWLEQHAFPPRLPLDAPCPRGARAHGAGS